MSLDLGVSLDALLSFAFQPRAMSPHFCDRMQSGEHPCSGSGGCVLSGGTPLDISIFSFWAGQGG